MQNVRSKLSIRVLAGQVLAWAVAANCLANPAVAADFCGRTTGEPDVLQGEISKSAGVKEIFRGPEYVAYQDEASQAVFSFTEAAQGKAHPAAVCRRPVKDGDSITLQMVIICKGDSEACQRLEGDFKLLNARMEAAIRNDAANKK
ncbi:MAG: hypothetical protein ABL901_02320 [Hyphomicrobiaceae bacterium]